MHGKRRSGRRVPLADLKSGFDGLVSHYSRYVYGVVRCFVSSDDVEDIVQETFISAYLSLERHPEKISALKIRPWLRVISKSTSLNYRAHRARNQTLSLEAFQEAGGQLVGNRLEEVEGGLVRREIMKEISSWLADLQENDDVAILSLHFFKGLKYSEIAATLGVSVDVVRKHAIRALMRIQKNLTIKFGSTEISELLIS